MEGQIAGLIGLFGGAFMGLVGLFLGRRLAKKQRGLDETHQHIWIKSRSIAWYATLFSIYILFTLHLIGIPLTVSLVLGILLFIHLGTWAIVGIILSSYLYK